jgi:lysine biosynthesis protein LysW
MAGALCPNCQAMVTVVGPEIWTMTKCADCGIELEIISVDPFEVDFPLDYWDHVDEDDDDDDDDYDEL